MHSCLYSFGHTGFSMKKIPWLEHMCALMAYIASTDVCLKYNEAFY